MSLKDISIMQNKGLLDRRSERDFYTQSWELATKYFPRWASSYPSNFTPNFNDQSIADPGLVMLRIFSTLSRQLTFELNRTPKNQNLAFYDYLGLVQQLPVSAKVPLVYTLAENTASVLIEKGRQVSSENDPTIIFEMVRDLYVLSVSIEQIIFLNPDNDTYTYYGKFISTDDITKQTDHKLYLGDPILFNFNSPTSRVEITFDGSSLKKHWFKQWKFFQNEKLLQSSIVANYDTLKATLVSIDSPETEAPQIPQQLNLDPACSWLEIQPNEQIRVLENDDQLLPSISCITANLIDDTGIIPDYTAFNDAPLDIKKGAEPFGDTPETNDAFYIGSTVFEMTGAKITFSVTVIPISISKISAQLVWESWNGLNWIPLKVKDGTNAFTSSGNITFKISDQIIPAEINGQESFWIRCRIASGAYGSDGKEVVTLSAEQVISMIPDSILCGTCTENIEANENLTAWINKNQSLLSKSGLTEEPFVMPVCTCPDCSERRKEILEWFDANHINFGFEYIPAEYWPPYIESLLIKFEYTKAPSTTLTLNGFSWSNLEIDSRPYLRLKQPPGFYIGFQLKSTDDIIGESLTMLFQFQETDISSKIDHDWSYWNGEEWVPLVIEWVSYEIFNAVLVSAKIPEDIQKTSLVDSNQYYWIRLTSDGFSEYTTQLVGIYTNAGIAEGHTTFLDEIIGSGTGQPDLTLSTSNSPIQSLTLQVFESNDESSSNTNNVDSSDSETMDDDSNATDGPNGIWRDWKQVDNFTFSKPQDRVYILDMEKGMILFGNGVNGMPPPQGSNNIRVASYRVPLSKIKSINAINTIDQLETSVSGLESVTNPMISSGAVTRENRTNFLRKAPALLKSRHRAMSDGDFIALAKEASPEVRYAFIEKSKTQLYIKIVILTKEVINYYSPTESLIDTVQNYIRERALSCCQNQIMVSAPTYEIVNVYLSIELNDPTTNKSQKALFKDEIKSIVENYFNPVINTSRNNGRKPDTTIYLKNLETKIKDLSYVHNGTIKDNSGNDTIKINEYCLPKIGSTAVRFQSPRYLKNNLTPALS